MLISDWLYFIASVSLILAGICAAIIAIDLITHSQKMWIMNVVWPITALYAGPLAVVAYFTTGRLSSKQSVERATKEGKENPGKTKPFWQIAAVGATHCGSGCTIGDLIAEWLVLLIPLSLFGHAIFGTWALDFVVAYLFGVAFQYFTIKPMKNLSAGQGLWAAIKADTLSLTAWQIGMYGWMAFVSFGIFGHEIPKTNPVFWFMMQIAMLAGFLTSYPVNWWLIREGIKEPM